MQDEYIGGDGRGVGRVGRAGGCVGSRGTEIGGDDAVRRAAVWSVGNRWEIGGVRECGACGVWGCGAQCGRVCRRQWRAVGGGVGWCYTVCGEVWAVAGWGGMGYTVYSV